MGDMVGGPRGVGFSAMASPVGVISHLAMPRIIADFEFEFKIFGQFRMPILTSRDGRDAAIACRGRWRRGRDGCRLRMRAVRGREGCGARANRFLSRRA